MKAFGLALIIVCAVAAPAHGQAPPSTNAEAKRHFQEGVRHAELGDVPKALQEFEAAYAVQPNFSVLYNIGQAHTALGHPVEATASFERYLAEGAEQVSSSRRAEVANLLTTNQARIGVLQLVAPAPARLRVWLDGSEITEDRWSAPLRLAAGPHSLLSFEEGCSPSAQTAVVVAANTVSVELMHGSGCTKPLGQLEIACAVPDVEVSVGGKPNRVRTPLQRPLLVPVGEVTIQFRRAGYIPVSRSIRVTESKLARIECEQQPIEPLAPTIAARLVVDRSPTDASVLVDGRLFNGSALPAGVHEVVVEHEGFDPIRRTLTLAPGKTMVLSAPLKKDAQRLARDKTLASRRTKGAFILGGLGVGLLGTAGGLYAWNSRRYTDWRDGAGGSRAQVDLALATSVQRVDDLSVALALLGAGLASTGAWLYFAVE